MIPQSNRATRRAEVSLARKLEVKFPEFFAEIEWKEFRSFKAGDIKMTPTRARTILDHFMYERQRKVNTGAVSQYEEAILEKAWKPNGESIKFTRHGICIDGQHRLRAIIASGITVWLFVVIDLDVEVYDTLDTGEVRKVSHQLESNGVDKKWSVVTANALGYLEAYIKGIPDLSPGKIRKKDKLKRNGKVSLFLEHQEIAKSGKLYFENKVGDFAPPGYFIFLHYITSHGLKMENGILVQGRENPVEATQFMKDIKLFANLDALDPVRTLVSYGTKASYRNLNALERRAVVTKTWNKTIRRVPVTKVSELAWRVAPASSERVSVYPKILGL